MAFLIENWQWVFPLAMAGLGFGAYAWFMRSAAALLATASIIGCLVFAGTIYKLGSDQEYARILAESKAKNAEALRKMEQQRKVDEARIRALQTVVDDTPPSSTISLKADRVGRIRSVK
jgi:hypothetical protein